MPTSVCVCVWAGGGGAGGVMRSRVWDCKKAPATPHWHMQPATPPSRTTYLVGKVGKVMGQPGCTTPKPLKDINSPSQIHSNGQNHGYFKEDKD